jgi:hypothetical protein
MPFSLPFTIPAIPAPLQIGLTALLLLWTFFWKGLALWRSAQYKQKYWFIAILLLNSIGILEIAYLFAFSKKKLDIAQLKSLLNFK